MNSRNGLLVIRRVMQALENPKAKSNDKDIIEVRNYSDALESIETLAKGKKKLKIRDMCDVQWASTKRV